jgi:uroporphyrinogen III methyltransferase/synthase
VLALYETVAEPPSEAQTAALKEITYVTFTSSSTVKFFLSGRGLVTDGARVVSIGPVTSETLREHGIEPDVEAQQHDIDGLVAALLADAT